MNSEYDFDLARYNQHLFVTEAEELVILVDDSDPIVEKLNRDEEPYRY
jgi:hypothetical protein